MPGVSVEKHDGGIAVISLAKEPVNSMDLTFWEELLAAFDSCEDDKAVRAVVFHSALKKNVFTAGLDLKELFAPTTSKDRLLKFWATLSKTLVKVYGTSMVTMAAIPGACPAGGCCLALCCDFRIITAAGSMGLNEVALGIPVPQYWIELMASTIGQRQAELALQTGIMIPSERLLQINMVDVVVKEPSEVLPRAVQEAGRWLKNQDAGRAATKAVLRGPLAKRWADGTDSEASQVWASISDPKTVAMLKAVQERLGGGKAKKPEAKL
eukprot:gnl/MRDRNA2_/MRDRNA2_106438_c0_seq1.p1 gnl/MRDRNA2_/MRDRNA2_106438_c0~~gnl/MRDRNA2_/MRDRNA2_106438_c0_seq1.p1  ORF type:complete len:294 (+),score=70.97 gnl/MRDRNA2_/MRDRNA2_106438_c0_seq1:80-883(+)